jgi:MFS family permease
VLTCHSTNAAPSLGPVLGGILAEMVGWRWIFWLLSIMSGTLLLELVLFFPETCRQLVRDGAVPATGLNRTVYDLLRSGRSPSKAEASSAKTKAFHVPNPLTILAVLGDKGSFVIILVGSVVYTVFGCLGASLSAQCIQIYQLNYLQAGLIYLPSGVGGILAAYTTGQHTRQAFHDYSGNRFI